MTGTLVDTNVLLDVIEVRPEWEPWSKAQLIAARLQSKIVINPIIYAEASTPYVDEKEFDFIITGAGVVKEELPFEAAFGAAKAYKNYRGRSGAKLLPLPDFFIAAHALCRDYWLLTRDSARFRTYFPDLKIIAPDTHP